MAFSYFRSSRRAGERRGYAHIRELNRKGSAAVPAAEAGVAPGSSPTNISGEDAGNCKRDARAPHDENILPAAPSASENSTERERSSSAARSGPGGLPQGDKICVHIWNQPDANGEIRCRYCGALKLEEAA